MRYRYIKENTEHVFELWRVEVDNQQDAVQPLHKHVTTMMTKCCANNLMQPLASNIILSLANGNAERRSLQFPGEVDIGICSKSGVFIYVRFEVAESLICVQYGLA